MYECYMAISNISLPSSLRHAQSLIFRRKEVKATKEDLATLKQTKKSSFLATVCLR